MRASLARAIHFHQPVGNFDHVIERAADNCYIPFIELLKKYPGIKIGFHFSGCLLEWCGKKRPEIIDSVRVLAERGQVEMISGGFYEPIMPSIPPHDRAGQIKMLTNYIKNNFGSHAEGAWVAERVWEPGLASCYHDAGIKYVILDDTHLVYSGVPRDKMYGYYVTEDDARGVAVFPTDKNLRYGVPFKMPNEITDYMKGVASKKENPLFVYGDDGEKFGEWPGTHKWVYEEKWLEKFFDHIMENSGWLSTVKMGDSLKERAPEGKVYIGTASYDEMLEWALPAQAQKEMECVINDMNASGKGELYKPFVRGGFWRNFLSKYPESDHMNKKMIYVSRKLGKVKKTEKNASDFLEAEKELFRGQCNCAYWHGVFGGLYLFHLRRAIYHHLINCEKIIDKMAHGKKQFSQGHVFDIDADSADEVVIENRELSLYFDPAEGGALKELDSKAMGHNFINSLSRKEEAYHHKIIEKIAEEKESHQKPKTIHDGIQVADSGIKDQLNYDTHGRYSLVDHFLEECLSLDAFSRGRYLEAGSFVNGNYGFKVSEEKDGTRLVMEKEGLVSGSLIRLTKDIKVPHHGTSFTVNYTIVNMEDRAVSLTFAPEFNLTMPDADSPEYFFEIDKGKGHHSLGMGSMFESEVAHEISVKSHDKGALFGMSFSEKCLIWHFPVKTVSQSEKAYELNYQSSAILPVIKLALRALGEARFEIRVNL